MYFFGSVIFPSLTVLLIRHYAFKEKLNMYRIYEHPPHKKITYFEKALGSNRLLKDDENDL